MFLICLLSDMHLSDFLCASLGQCYIPGLREKKVIRLFNLICEFAKLGGGGGSKFGLLNGNFPRCQSYGWIEKPVLLFINLVCIQLICPLFSTNL